MIADYGVTAAEKLAGELGDRRLSVLKVDAEEKNDNEPFPSWDQEGTLERHDQ